MANTVNNLLELEFISSYNTQYTEITVVHAKSDVLSKAERWRKKEVEMFQDLSLPHLN